MKKAKKILALAFAFVFTVVCTVGATIAWLQDDDAQTNTFTVGNVDIDLEENYTQDSKLLPVTGSAQNGTLENGVTKEVYVKNMGSEDAYVRVHIAIPSVLDDGADTFDASANILHFNFDEESIGEKKWDWSKTTGTPYTGDWNYYTTEIDGIKYNVYVVTYETALAGKVGETIAQTEYAMNQVYLDKDVTNEDITKLKATLGEKWNIKVVAEGVQAAGFDNAYDALNSAFGVPGAEGYDPFNK